KGEADANGWKWCELKACYAQLRERICPAERDANRRPKIYSQQLSPYHQQDPEAYAAGEVWIGDHKQLDLWCLSGKTIVRPWLTVWKDWRTRLVTGWVLSDQPNSSTIMAALRRGLMDDRNLGGPDLVKIDNGRDYSARVFHGRSKQERGKK